LETRLLYLLYKGKCIVVSFSLSSRVTGQYFERHSRLLIHLLPLSLSLFQRCVTDVVETALLNNVTISES